MWRMKGFYTWIFLERSLWSLVLKMDLIKELGDGEVTLGQGQGGQEEREGNVLWIFVGKINRTQ